MTSTARPMSFARGPNGDVYGVNGLERGVRYDVIANQNHNLGIDAPTVAPTITVSSKAPRYYVAGVDVVYGGFNYTTAPTLTFSGGSGSNAVAKAELSDGRVSAITMQNYGSGFTGTPSVSISAPSSTSPYGSGATFAVSGSGGLGAVTLTNIGGGYTTEPSVTVAEGGTPATLTAVSDGWSLTSVGITSPGSGYSSTPSVTVSAPDPGGTLASVTVTIDPATGQIATAKITSAGSGYLSSPTLTVNGGRGTGALCRAEIDPNTGVVTSIYVVNPGIGYREPPAITISAGSPTAAAEAVLSMSVDSVTVTKAGSGYFGSPALNFSSLKGSGAYATCVADPADGSITSVNLQASGDYAVLPTASLDLPDYLCPAKAILAPVMKPALCGKYWCAYRYIDGTPESRNGPIPSNLSPITEVEITSPAGSLTWSVTSSANGRVTGVELWRTTADQALVMYRVGRFAQLSSGLDAVGDNELIDPSRTIGGEKVFGVMPIVLPNGAVNAYRFTPPPQNKAVVVMFQDRAWYGVDNASRVFSGTPGAGVDPPDERNTLYFSEIGEPESVPETNQLVLQNNIRSEDSITALMPFGGGMVIFQNRHAYRMTYSSQPIQDASVQLLCQRGCLNQRCWDVHDGVAYVVDGIGMYALEGGSAVSLSDVVEPLWSSGTINLASSTWFFVRVDPVTRIVRFFYNESGTYPDRALCYHPVTKAWWVEQFAQRISSSECVSTGGRYRAVVSGESGGVMVLDSGAQDITAAGGSQTIACSYRSGNFALSADGNSRSVRVLYKPDTPGDGATSYLTLGLHYNNSSTARPNAVATSRGTGFTTDAAQNAVLDMSKTRSQLGDATGYAVASFAGRVDDKSAGGDRHLAIALSTTRTGTNPAVLYGAAIEGVNQ